VLITLAALIGETVWALRLTARMRREQLALLERHRAPYGLPAPAARPPSQLLGWLLLVPGILLACGGGLMVLALAVALLQGGMKPDERTATIGGGFIIGVLPLALGIVLFAFGVRALNRSSQVAPLPRPAGI